MCCPCTEVRTRETVTYRFPTDTCMSRRAKRMSSLREAVTSCCLEGICMSRRTERITSALQPTQGRSIWLEHSASIDKLETGGCNGAEGSHVWPSEPGAARTIESAGKCTRTLPTQPAQRQREGCTNHQTLPCLAESHSQWQRRGRPSLNVQPARSAHQLCR
jgi:hypothetical protein